MTGPILIINTRNLLNKVFDGPHAVIPLELFIRIHGAGLVHVVDKLTDGRIAFGVNERVLVENGRENSRTAPRQAT